MTRLEERLSRTVWNRYRERWTTVLKNVGFALYQRGDRMWLCGYSPEVVAKRLGFHGDKAPYITIYSTPQKESMFNIPASNDFVSAIILGHYQELLS